MEEEEEEETEQEAMEGYQRNTLGEGGEEGRTVQGRMQYRLLPTFSFSMAHRNRSLNHQFTPPSKRDWLWYYIFKAAPDQALSYLDGGQQAAARSSTGQAQDFGIQYFGIAAAAAAAAADTNRACLAAAAAAAPFVAWHG